MIELRFKSRLFRSYTLNHDYNHSGNDSRNYSYYSERLWSAWSQWWQGEARQALGMEGPVTLGSLLLPFGRAGSGRKGSNGWKELPF